MPGYTDEERIFRKDDQFDFRIFSSPQEIMEILKEKEADKPNSARIVAGFCWPWSNKADANGDLVKDVRIGEFAMPWETHDNRTLLTRGMKGCYVYFTDKETEGYFRGRMEK